MRVDHLQYGKRLENIRSDVKGVNASFSDGAQMYADLIVGCDGAQSVVRKMLVGKEAAENSETDINFVNLATSFGRETSALIRAQHPIFFNSFHPKGWMYLTRILDVPRPNDPASWVFQVLVSWKGAPTSGDLPTKHERTEWLREKAEEYVDPWRSALRALPAKASFDIESAKFWRPMDWSSSPLAGRVTLAGDAAHSV